MMPKREARVWLVECIPVPWCEELRQQWAKHPPDVDYLGDTRGGTVWPVSLRRARRFTTRKDARAEAKRISAKWNKPGLRLWRLRVVEE